MRGRSISCVVALSLLSASAAQALVGETRDAGALAPHTLMVLKRSGARSGFCTGVALSRRVVLTGAHCVSSPADTRVHFIDAAGAPLLLEPSRIARHPGFQADAVRKRLASVDLALIDMRDDLPPSFIPAELAPDAKGRSGDKFTIVGYGQREDGGAGRLAAVTLVLREPLSSLLMWLVAANPPGGACEGDSGAPAFDADGRVAGVVAFAEGNAGRRCGKLTQAVRVAPQRGWIESTMAQWAR